MISPSIHLKISLSRLGQSSLLYLYYTIAVYFCTVDLACSSTMSCWLFGLAPDWTFVTQYWHMKTACIPDISAPKACSCSVQNTKPAGSVLGHRALWHHNFSPPRPQSKWISATCCWNSCWRAVPSHWLHGEVQMGFALNNSEAARGDIGHLLPVALCQPIHWTSSDTMAFCLQILRLVQICLCT